jgi:hypothetical protein
MTITAGLSALLFALGAPNTAWAAPPNRQELRSPDAKLVVSIETGASVTYAASYDGAQIIAPSAGRATRKRQHATNRSHLASCRGREELCRSGPL